MNDEECLGVETQRSDNEGAALVECVGQFAHVSALRPQHHRLQSVESEFSHESARVLVAQRAQVGRARYNQARKANDAARSSC